MNSALALAAKALTMVVSLVCGVATTRLLLGHTGVENYALYNLLATLPSLLSFTDLGSGAVIVNRVATSPKPSEDVELYAELTTVGRILCAFAGVTMLVNIALLVTGGWTVVLGDSGSQPHAALAAFICLSVFSLGVPVGIWVRILLGLRRNHLVILLQGLISPLTLLGVWLGLRVGDASATSFLALASFTASFLVSVLGILFTGRMTAPLISTARSRLLRRRAYPSVRVMDVGLPMLAQLVSFPIGVSSQRYILAQRGTPHDVALYAVAGQVFFALNGLVLAAGVALWPHFAARRAVGELKRGPYALSLSFAVSVATATLAVWALREPIFDFIGNGQIEMPGSVILAFGALVTATAALYPLGMFIMDKPGITFQVIPTLAMAGTSVVLSVLLAGPWGASGPPVGSALAILLCQVAPFILYIRRHRARLLGRQVQVTPAR